MAGVVMLAVMLAVGNLHALIAQRGAATTATGTTSLTIGKPAGVVAGDVMVVVITKLGTTNALTPPANWTSISQATLRSSTTLTYGAVMYRVADASDGAVANYVFSMNASTTSAVGDIVAFSGVDTAGGLLVGGGAGGPFDVAPGSILANTGGATSVGASAITNNIANSAILMLGMAGGTATWSGWTNASLGALTEIADHQNPSGGSVGVAWATKVVAGATGAGAATLSTSQRNGGIFLALRAFTSPANAANSTVSAVPGSVAADGINTATITVTLKDGTNGAVWGKTVTLVSDRGATDTISAASGLSAASGVVTFTVKSTTPGSPVFTATDTNDSVTVTQTATVTFNPAASVDAGTSTVSASPGSLAADNIATTIVTVTLKDAGGSPVAGKTVTLASNRGAADTISAASGNSDVSGVVTFTVKSATAGSPVFTATDTSDSVIITQTATVNFTAIPIALRSAATAGSTTGTTLTLNVPAGVVAGDVMIMNMAQYGTGSGNPTCVGWTLIGGSTNGLGASTSRYGALMYRIAGASELASYTFTLAGTVTGAAGAIVAFSGADPGTPFDAAPVPILSASSTAVGATAVTSISTNAPAIMFGMAATATAGPGTWTNWSSTTPAATLTEIYEYQNSGTVNTAITVGAAIKTMTTPGTTGTGAATLSTSMRSGGIWIVLKPLTAPANAANSTVLASPASLAADGITTATVTVTLLNGAGNPVAGKTVTLASSRGAADTISAASGLSSASGVVTFTVKSATAGSSIFTATNVSDGFAVPQTASVTFIVVPAASATLSTVSGSPASISADGATTSTITVTLLDAGGNPTPAKTVTLASSRGATDTISAASGPSSASGVVTFTVRSTTAGSPIFTATDTTDSVVVGQTASVTFVASSAKDILTFGPGATISGTNVLWAVASGTSVTSLAPTYTVSPFANGSPASGAVRNFTTPQNYTVTAQDGSTITYLATVAVSLPPQNYGISGDTDLAQEFSPMNRSGHPVVTGLNSYSNSPAPRALASGQLKAPWNGSLGSQTMLCSDCHDTTTTNYNPAVAQGPHGSAYQFMLRGPNGNNWPNTTSFASSWCANCHIDNVSFNGSHGTHYSNPGCYACHIVIPHGGKMSRLIGDKDGAMPARYAFNNDFTNIYVYSFTKASSATSYGKGNCRNTCTGGHTASSTNSMENW